MSFADELQGPPHERQEVPRLLPHATTVERSDAAAAVAARWSGSPIAHSLSPVLHRAAYAALGLDWAYDAHEVAEPGLPAFLAGLDGVLARAVADDAAQARPWCRCSTR